MKQVHGPYRLLAGQHSESVPSLDKDGKQLKITVSQLQPSYVIAEDGRKLPIDRGTFLLLDGVSHSLWRDERRVALTEVVPGDSIELCHSVEYGPEYTPKNLRRSGVVYAPFMSSKELDLLHNKPGAMKFALATDRAQGDEIAELRRQNQEMMERIADQSRQVPQADKPLNESAKKSADKRQLQPAS